ncbi:MAG: hypothetical protein ACRD5H_03220, partial [Nitrososphaerales archaeon]
MQWLSIPHVPYMLNNIPSTSCIKITKVLSQKLMLLVTGLAVASLFIIPIPEEQKQAHGLPRPNIVVIMADDLDQRSIDR